jgi:hypothetical protein
MTGFSIHGCRPYDGVRCTVNDSTKWTAHYDCCEWRPGYASRVGSGATIDPSPLAIDHGAGRLTSFETPAHRATATAGRVRNIRIPTDRRAFGRASCGRLSVTVARP